MFDRIDSSSDNNLDPLISLKERRYRSFWKIVAIASNLTLGGFYFGYCLAYLATVPFDDIVEIYGITIEKDLAQGLLVGGVPIGGVIGCGLGLLLQKYVSPKWAILIINIFSLLVGGLILIQNQFSLLFCRICQGICAGCYSSIVPPVVMQIAPKQISGTIGSLFEIQVSISILFAFLLQLIFAETIVNPWIYYYLLFAFPLLITVIQTLVILFVFPFETPRYLLAKGRSEEAKELLRILYYDRYVETIFEEEIQDFEVLSSQDASELGRSFQDANPEQVDQDSARSPYINSHQSKLPLAHPGLVTKLLAIHLAFMQELSGVNILLGYAPQIVAEVFPSLEEIVPVTINLEPVIGSILAGYVLSKFGRRLIFQIGTIVNVVYLVFLTAGFFVYEESASDNTIAGILILIGLYICMFNFGLTLGPIIWIYIPEIVPSNFMPIAAMANWLGAAIMMVGFPIIIAQLPNQNPAPVFAVLAIYSVICFFIQQRFMVETKDKSEADIMIQFQLKKCL